MKQNVYSYFQLEWKELKKETNKSFCLQYVFTFLLLSCYYIVNGWK